MDNRRESTDLVYMKIHSNEQGTVVAICDAELLGRTFSEGDVRLHVDPNFYAGELVPLSYAIERAREAEILNLVGERVVSAAIEAGYVHPASVIKVEGVPHAQSIRIPFE
ncbi:MAG: DUF424 family protein [Thermoproteota archaeon]